MKTKQCIAMDLAFLRRAERFIKRKRLGKNVRVQAALDTLRSETDSIVRQQLIRG
jgi:hypothetical protein